MENDNLKDSELKDIDAKGKQFNCILIKIKYKPVIMDSIYSFTKNRPYILLDLISDNKILKSGLKNTFDNTKKNNDLSKDLNNNINNYIYNRKIIGGISIKIKKIEKKVVSNFKLKSIIKRPLIESHFFENYEIKQFINNSKLVVGDSFIKKFIDKDYQNLKKEILDLYYEKYQQYCKSEDNSSYKIYFNSYSKITYKWLLNNYKDLINEKFFNSEIQSELKLLKNKKIKFKGKSREIINYITYYNYFISQENIYESLLRMLCKENDVETFLDIIYFIYNDYFSIMDKNKFNFYKYPNLTKKYRKWCMKKQKKDIEKKGYDLYIENKKNSIIKLLIKEYIKSEKELVNLCFDYLSTLDHIILYNLPKGNVKDLENEQESEFLDEKYLRYIENKNIKQKVKLICIIDRYKYCEYINNIIYPNIYELHFKLFTEATFNELFMFDNIPIKEIYFIFITYFLNIKHYMDIKKISFGEEFFINKNQFISYNDEYYQSIISYLIDQYLACYNKSKENVLENINLEEIELKEENLDNINERYKIIYGFNKMFPNLKNKKLLEMTYANIIDNTCVNVNDINCNYKIIIINFEDIQINDNFNTIIENIKNFILKKLSNNINNIEILSFKNIQIKINNNNNDTFIDSCNLNFLPGLKVFFINNKNNSIINGCNINKFKNIFDFVYFGYDSNNNIMYYKVSKEQIKSTDILDLVNLYNNKIVKLNLKNEYIDIMLNEDRTELKIINLTKHYNNQNTNNKERNFYFFPLKNLSDFINNQNTLTNLIIKGFDFIFEEIENKNIKKLSINYFNNEDECTKMFNYKLNTLDNNDTRIISLIEDDLILENKFPKLEEISIGNIDNENMLYKKLFKQSNFNKTLKKINIITYQDFKLSKKFNTHIEVIISSRKIRNNMPINNDINDKEYEDEEEEEEYYEYEYEDEYDNLFYDKYDDILNDNNSVVTNITKKNKKHKKDNKKQEKENKINIIGERLNTHKSIKENIFKKDIETYIKNENILYFKSELINNINEYYLIQQSLLLVNNNFDKNKNKFVKIHYSLFDLKIINEYKKTPNLLLILLTFTGIKICLYNKNSTNLQKGGDFCLFLNDNEIYYHEKEDKNKKKNEIFRETSNIDKDKNVKLENSMKTFIKYFFDVHFHYEFYEKKKINNENNIEFMELFQIC